MVNINKNRQAHKRLVDAVNNLKKSQNISTSTRTETLANQDEFSLMKNSKPAVHPTDLNRTGPSLKITDIVQVLKSTEKHSGTGQLLKNVKKTQAAINRPAGKLTSDRIKRSTGYENVNKQLERWDAVVSKNRSAESQVFPLPLSETIYVDTLRYDKHLERNVASGLMKEMSSIDKKLKVLRGNQCDKEGQTQEEEIILTTKLTRDELLKRRNELAYIKVRQSQAQSKLRIQNKVKSKRYHKILKRQKIRKQLNDFELLQKSNPEAALERLNRIDKNRIFERTSLRHKNTGTWAKNRQMYAKYDKGVKEQLAEQLQIGRELIKNTTHLIDDNELSADSLDKNNELEVDKFVDGPLNPWTKIRQLKNNDHQTESGINWRKYWIGTSINQEVDQCNKTRKADLAKELNEKTLVYEHGWLVEELPEGKTGHSVPAELDNIFNKKELELNQRFDEKVSKVTCGSEKSRELKKTKSSLEWKKVSDAKIPCSNFKVTKSQRLKIDEGLGVAPKQHLLKEAYLDCLQKTNEIEPVSYCFDEEKKLMCINLQKNDEVQDLNLDLDANVFADTNISNGRKSERQIAIGNVFEDDDIVADFTKDLQDASNKNDNEVNLTMAGWGSWAGAGLKPKNRIIPNQYLVLQLGREFKEHKTKKNTVCINEDSSKELRSHMVSALPFPYKRVEDFESSIHAPMGRNSVPETVFRFLSHPSVRTRKGQVIEPMDDSELVRVPRRLQHAIADA